MYVYIVHRNCGLKHLMEGKIERKVIRGSRRKQLAISLRKWEDNGNCKKKRQIALYIELAVEKAKNLS